MAKKTGKAKPDAGTKVLKELKAEVKRLETGLTKAEAKIERWKAKADRHKAETTRALAQIVKLEKRPTTTARPLAPAAADPAPLTVVPEVTKVDTSWTIVRLREEARTRGVAYSGKSKAQLLAALP